MDGAGISSQILHSNCFCLKKCRNNLIKKCADDSYIDSSAHLSH